MDRELLCLQDRAGSALSGGPGAGLRACSSPPLPSADGAPWKEFESNWSPPQRQSSVSLLTKYRPQSFETSPDRWDVKRADIGTLGYSVFERSGYPVPVTR